MPSEIKDALEELRRCTNRKNYKQQAIVLNDLAKLYRDKEDFKNTRKYYRQTIQLSDKLKKGDADVIRAFRALAEISAENDESRDDIILALAEYRTAAKLSNHSQIQLSLHVAAWIYERIYTRGKRLEGELQQAASLCDESIKYLIKYREHIDQDKEEVEDGGNFGKRMGNLKRLYSSICVLLHDMEKAQKLWKDAELYARKTKDRDLLYELLKTKLDFSTNTERDYLNLSQRMVNEAPAGKKGEALMFLSMARLFVNDISGSFNELFKLFGDAKLMKRLPSEDQEDVKYRLAELSRMKDWIDEAADHSKCSKKRRRNIYEWIGDATARFEGDWRLLAVGLIYYGKMFELSATESEEKVATESLAVTSLEIAMELNSEEAWRKTLKYHENLLNYTDYTRTLITKCEIFEIKCKGKLLSQVNLKSEFESLEQEIPNTPEFFRCKSKMCGAFGNYLSGADPYVAKEYFKKEKELLSICEETTIDDINECVEDEDAGREGGEMDSITRTNILKKIKDKSNYQNILDKLKEKCNKVINNDGETHLHDAARNNDQAHLKKLLEMGYDPNIKDNSGFTALSEAVLNGVLANVRILLLNNATIDVISIRGLYDEHSESGGVTPLMEACHTGNSEMINLLLQFKASVVLANEDKWTAVDFLRDYRDSRAGEEELPYIDDLLNKMEAEQRKAGYPVRKGPPPPWQNRIPKTFKADNKRKRRSSDNEGKENLHKYQKTMDSVGSRVSRQEHCASDDEEISQSDIFENDEISGGEPYSCLPSPPSTFETTSRQGSFELGKSCEVLETRKSNAGVDYPDDDIEIFEPDSSFPAPHRSSDSNFIVDDSRPPSKKRRNAGQREDIKKKRSDIEYLSNVIDSQMANTPSKLMNNGVKSSLRHSRILFSDDEDNTRASTSTYPDDSSFTGMYRSSYVSSTINVTVHCFDDNMEQFKVPKMDSLPSDSTLLAIRKLYKERLDAHQQQFDLRQDGIEIDDTVVISSLPSTNGRYIFHLVLKPVTALSIYLANSGSSTNADILELLRNLEISKNMNLSTIECDNELTLVLKAVAESNTQICELLLDKCHIKEDAYKYLGTVMPNAAKISLKSTGICSRFLEFTVKTDNAQFGVTIMDLSFTNLKCGKSLASLLKLTPQLKELILRGVDISQGESDLSFSICGLSKLQKLDLTCCDWLLADNVNAILSGCSRLTSLFLTGVNLGDVEFEPRFLPECRHLSMAATGFTQWGSLCSWLAAEHACAETVDVSSCNSLNHKELDGIINARSEMNKMLTMKIVRCDSLLCDFLPVLKRLEDVVTFRKLKRSSILAPLVLEVSTDVYDKSKGQEPNSSLYIKQA